MKNFYIAVQIQENGLYYAYCIRVNESRNIWADLSRIPGLIAANIMPTKKAARAVVAAWNDSWRNDGKSMINTMPDGSPAPF